MKWLRKLFDNQNISNLRLEVQELKATLQVTRIELFEYLEKVMSPLAKRLSVRISRENKDLSSAEPMKKGGILTPSQILQMKQDGIIK